MNPLNSKGKYAPRFAALRLARCLRVSWEMSLYLQQVLSYRGVSCALLLNKNSNASSTISKANDGSQSNLDYSFGT